MKPNMMALRVTASLASGRWASAPPARSTTSTHMKEEALRMVVCS